MSTLLHPFSTRVGDFIDSFRSLFIFSTFIVITILGLYSFLVGLEEDRKFEEILSDCLSQRVLCPTKTITVSGEIQSIGTDSALVFIRTRDGARWEDLFDRDHEVLVIGNQLPPDIGRIVALQGQFLSNNQFLLEAYQAEKRGIREAKYIISLFGLLMTIIIWARTFRFSFKNFEFELKHNNSDA